MFGLAILAVALAPAWGQKLDFNFDNLAAKARDKAEVSIEGPLLDILKNKTSAKGTDGVFANVTGLFIRNYEFAKAGEYTEADLASLRKQVAGAPGWSRIINVKDGDETSEIYQYSAGGKPAGFLISAEPKELTVVQIEGSVQLAQLHELVESSVQFDLKKLPTAQ